MKKHAFIKHNLRNLEEKFESLQRQFNDQQEQILNLRKVESVSVDNPVNVRGIEFSMLRVFHDHYREPNKQSNGYASDYAGEEISKMLIYHLTHYEKITGISHLEYFMGKKPIYNVIPYENK